MPRHWDFVKLNHRLKFSTASYVLRDPFHRLIVAYGCKVAAFSNDFR